MGVKEKMIRAFREANGGLFSAVEKADVGSSYQEMEKQGIALMGWADPFMPDFSLPKPLYGSDWRFVLETGDCGETMEEKRP